MKPVIIIPFLCLFICLLSCKKDDHPGNPTPPPPPPPPASNEILLKDIVHSGLPSPYYHFEYDTARRYTKASFLSGDRLYAITHANHKLDGIKNNTMVNKDSIDYNYDNTGHADYIKIINEAGVVYKRAFLSYNANQLIKIEWERKMPTGGYVMERTITLTYYNDGNLKELTSNRPPFEGQTEVNYSETFEDYDTKINTDGFAVIHDEKDHLILIPGIVIQKNNARKVTRTSTKLISYIIDYTYNYNDKNVPVSKNGNAIITNGVNQGQRFTTSTTFSYW